ncbi:MAG TPA: chemotaxis protein CheB [Bryobacteraceae bacterium]|nr:chemotaxis protein CheB [Bryobacteraceae bacterium]
MSVERVVVIGASAGGLEPLKILAHNLRSHPSTAYFVVLHLSPSGRSFLANILAAAGRLPAVQAVDGTLIESGKIYVPEPDRHMYLERSHVRSVRGPKENRHRPSVNTLFRSAARIYGKDSVGVVLSGVLDDGTVGLWEIKRAGGITIVQCPDEATFDAMPRSAIDNVQIDYVVPVSEIASIVNSLVGDSARIHEPHREESKLERELTGLTCPECRGPLNEQKLGRVLQLECRVGHVYSPESALDAHEDTQERTLWGAVVALEEGADLALRLIETHPDSAPALREAADEKRTHAQTIRQMVTGSRKRARVTPV